MQVFPHGGDVYRNPDAIDFSANINPLGPPQGVLSAIGEAVSQIKNYPDVCCDLLTKRIAVSEGVAYEEVICGNGAAELIFSLVLAKKPKVALLMAPTFLEYEQALKTVDCEIRYISTKREEAFAVPENILEEITKDVEMVFLCNPNNPTGTLTKSSLTLEVLKRCQKQEALFVVDECFMDFTEQSRDYTMKPYLGTYSNLFILKAFTKLYAMPGLRLGYGLSSNEALLRKMEEVTQPWNVSVLAQVAGVAALKETEYVKKSLEIIKEEQKRLLQALNDCSYLTLEPSANYIFFHGEESLGCYLLHRGICIRDCRNYRGLLPGDYRIAVKAPEENDRLIQLLKEKREEM